MIHTIFVCPECGSTSLASPGCTHKEGLTEVFGSEVPRERTVPRQAVRVVATEVVTRKLDVLRLTATEFYNGGEDELRQQVVDGIDSLLDLFGEEGS